MGSIRSLPRPLWGTKVSVMRVMEAGILRNGLPEDSNPVSLPLENRLHFNDLPRLRF